MFGSNFGRIACLLALSAVALGIATSLSATQQTQDARQALEHGARDEQIAALMSLETKSVLSADLAPPLFAFVAAEIARQAAPLNCAETADRIPYVGNEVDVPELQATLKQRNAVKGPLICAIRVSSTYRGTAKDLAKSHYALEATPLDEHGKRRGTTRAVAYLPRSFGGLLLERLATAPAGKLDTAVVRLEVSPLEPTPENGNLLVATDWQLLCDGTWSEWEFAGLRAAFRAIPKLGRAAVTDLVALVAREDVPRRPALTEALRAMSLGTLLNLDARERRQAAALIDRALLKKSGAGSAALIKARNALRASLER